MKRLFFFTVIDFANWKTDGVCKKIISQVRAFQEKGYKVDLCYMINGDTYIYTEGKKKCIGKKKGLINKGTVCKYVEKYVKDWTYDAIYIRYGFAEKNFYHLLKEFNKKCDKILIEIATYPYDKEFSEGFDRKIALILDKIYRNKLYKYSKKVVTFSDDKKIFHMPTIKTLNGIDFKNIDIRNIEEQQDGIHMIAVASMSKWHGYDRLIAGLGRYYQNSQSKKVYLHLVGDGEEIPNYKKQVEDFDIQEYVFFHGMKSGEELDSIYNKCDLAIASLGLHRLGVKLASTLKTREYAAKGLPIITSSEIDIFRSKEYPYIKKFDEDDTVIDVEEIVRFYCDIYEGKNKNDVAKNIREYAASICDMPVTMVEIFEFYDAES